jgi:uncharacterized protein
MFFVVYASDKPGQGELRASIRETHRAHLRNPGRHEVRVRLGGPTLDECGLEMRGTMLVIEADSIEAVRAFLADDPYCRAGLFASMEIRPWRWGIGLPEAC